MKWPTAAKILIIILLVGAFLRFYHLGQNSFVADEFLDINSSYGYFQTGEWRAWDFNFGAPSVVNENVVRDERASIYKWQVAQLFHFLPPTEATARTVSVLWGLVALGVVFWSTWIFTRSREISLIAAFLCAVSISAIIFDRRLRMYAMFFPLYLASALALFLALESAYRGRLKIVESWGKKISLHIPYAALALLLGTLSLLTHQLTATLAVTAFVYLVVRAVQEYRTDKRFKNKYSVLALLFIVLIVLTAILAPQFFGTFSRELIFFDDHYGYVRYILADYYHPLLAVFFLSLGAWWLGKQEGKRREAWYLYLSFLVPLALSIWLFRRNVGPQYIFFVQSFVMIAVAVGIYAAWQIVREKWSLKKGRDVVVVLGLLLLLLPNYGYFFAENNTYHETSSGSEPNYRKVFGYFKKHKGPNDALLTRNFRNYYWSGTNTPVLDFGGELSEKKLSLAEVENFMREHPVGWVVFSTNDYDYISREAEDFIKNTMERVSHSDVRGPIEVYRWGTQP